MIDSVHVLFDVNCVNGPPQLSVRGGHRRSFSNVQRTPAGAIGGRRRPIRGQFFAVGVLLLLTGCGSAVTNDAPVAADEFTGTVAEHREEMIACLAEEGLEAHVVIDYEGFQVLEVDAGTVGPETSERLVRIGAECDERVGTHPLAHTPEQQRELYDNRVSRRDCVVAAGYAPDPVPSFQVFVDGLTAGGEVWTPMDGLGVHDLVAAGTACPLDGDSWFN